MNDKKERRRLTLPNLDAVLADIENLRSKGYDRVGNWNLAQVCGHMAEWIRFPMDGFPKAGCAMGAVLGLMRMTIGAHLRKKILRTGKLPANGPTLKETVPPSDLDEATAVQRLTAEIERFKPYTGDLHPSPLLGRMDKQTWERIQVVHCAHHLSFLIPRMG